LNYVLGAVPVDLVGRFPLQRGAVLLVMVVLFALRVVRAQLVRVDTLPSKPQTLVLLAKAVGSSWLLGNPRARRALFRSTRAMLATAQAVILLLLPAVVMLLAAALKYQLAIAQLDRERVSS
jgi:hypothetical protein